MWTNQVSTARGKLSSALFDDCFSVACCSILSVGDCFLSGRRLAESVRNKYHRRASDHWAKELSQLSLDPSVILWVP